MKILEIFIQIDVNHMLNIDIRKSVKIFVIVLWYMSSSVIEFVQEQIKCQG